MTTINVVDYVNGYSVSIFNDGKYVINEICETRVEAFKIVQRFITAELIRDLKARQQYAGEGAI